MSEYKTKVALEKSKAKRPLVKLIIYGRAILLVQRILDRLDLRFWRRRVWRWLSSGMLRHVVSYKLTDVSEVLMMEAVNTFEISVSFY
jgi:hypothetical protein